MPSTARGPSTANSSAQSLSHFIRKWRSLRRKQTPSPSRSPLPLSGMRGPHSSGAPTASLELTPVGGRLSVVVHIPPDTSGTNSAEVCNLSEELDKLSFGQAHATQGANGSALSRADAACRAGATELNEKSESECNQRSAATSVTTRAQVLFRVEQQRMVDGQPVLRVSVWREPPKKIPLDSGLQGFPASAEAADEDACESSKTHKGALEAQPPSAWNFYFRLPCALTGLRLLGATFASRHTTAPTEEGDASAYDSQQQETSWTQIRLSLQCSLRPGSLAEAVQYREERSLRKLSSFRLTCKWVSLDFTDSPPFPIMYYVCLRGVHLWCLWPACRVCQSRHE